MPDSVYRVTEVIGVSKESWEAAAQTAVKTAANTVRDLRVAEVVRQDVVIENGRAGSEIDWCNTEQSSSRLL
ncbi:MAG: dodecin family protein [Mycobacterium sp.]